MNIKHTNPETKEETIHKKGLNGKTACGIDTTTHSDHWSDTSKEVDCEKNGCA